MKKSSLIVITCILVSASAYLFFVGACATQDKGGTTERTISDQSVYSVPEEKAQRWEKIQNLVKREHHICAEHCGYESNCLGRCKKAYENRMEREYQQLMHK